MGFQFTGSGQSETVSCELSMTHENRNKPSVVVELILDDVEFRLGEIRKKIVIYKRNERLYARTADEFAAKFRPIQRRS